MILGAIGEWIIGNTFPFVVFGTFGELFPVEQEPPTISVTRTILVHSTDQSSNIGAFWLTFGATLVPSFNAYGAYVTDPEVAAANMGNPGNPAGLQVPAFNASFAFFLVFMSTYNVLFVESETFTDPARPDLLHLHDLLPPD